MNFHLTINSEAIIKLAHFVGIVWSGWIWKDFERSNCETHFLSMRNVHRVLLSAAVLKHSEHLKRLEHLERTLLSKHIQDTCLSFLKVCKSVQRAKWRATGKCTRPNMRQAKMHQAKRRPVEECARPRDAATAQLLRADPGRLLIFDPPL